MWRGARGFWVHWVVFWVDWDCIGIWCSVYIFCTLSIVFLGWLIVLVHI
jgi:hypothetical protein